METIFCLVFIHFLKRFLLDSSLFRNHLHGQDTLFIEVFDEDKLKNDRIGSAKIDLKDLYEKSQLERKDLHNEIFDILGHIDQWFPIMIPSRSSSQGEIRLIIQYQPLRV